jgi:thymidylate synthase
MYCLGEFRTSSHAYTGILAAVLHDSVPRSPRGTPCREICNLMFGVKHPSPLPIVTESDNRNVIISDYTRKEMEMYLSGERSAEKWATISKFWGKLADPNGNITSQYGYLLFLNASCRGTWSNCHVTPITWVISELTTDPDSRRAVAHIAMPEHLWVGNPDQTCTMHMQFSIHEDKLDVSVVMRSQDVVKGLAYDLPFFMYVQAFVADKLHKAVGTYTHLSHSMHAYDRDIDVIKAMLLGDDYARN